VATKEGGKCSPFLECHVATQEDGKHSLFLGYLVAIKRKKVSNRRRICGYSRR